MAGPRNLRQRCWISWIATIGSAYNGSNVKQCGDPGRAVECGEVTVANTRWLRTAVSASAVAVLVGLSACGSSGNDNTATSGGSTSASTSGSFAPAVQFT